MEDPLPPDPYKALGVAKDATLANVRSAHRKLVLTCHPDKVTDESAKKAAADKFHLVQQAYEILSDDTRRQRYDERARLAELRADVSSQRNGRIIPEMVPRTKTTTFDMGRDRMYEERAPRRSYDDEEDYFQPRGGPRYQEVRPKRFDDRPFVQSPRKTSGRAPEDKRSRAKELARELEEERDRDRRKKEAAKADDKAYRAERNKRRDRERRRDSESKSKSTKNAYVEEDTDSDSDVTETIYPRREEPPRRRYDDDVRRPELPRRNTTKPQDYDSYDDYDRREKERVAQDYIAQSIAQARGPVEELRRPPPTPRAYSHVEARPPPTPKGSPLTPKGPLAPIDTRRSGREKARREPSPPPKLSKKDRRPTEIVDPPPTNRRPSLPIQSSDPRGLKGSLASGRKEPHRSQTLDTVPEQKPHPLKRAETMPIDRTRRSDNQPSKSSRLKEQHDSGYSSRSSRGTPDISPTESPQLKSTKYRYSQYDSTSDSEDEITIVAEPDGGYQRVRENSPRARRPPMTPQSASRMQVPPMRSGSFAMSPEQPPTPRTAPPFVRTESGRPPPPSRSRPSARGSLPYEIPIEGDSPGYRVVNQSPKIGREHINYSPRRGSEDVERERDAYPRPGLSRGDSRAVRA